jgi:hypothetical protein
MPGIFVYWTFKGPEEMTMHWFALEFFYLLIFNSGLKLMSDISNYYSE